jgi:hypothetical protein
LDSNEKICQHSPAFSTRAGLTTSPRNVEIARAQERRLAVMGAIVSAVILESHFRPKLLPKQQLQAVLDELYEALIHN